MEISILSTFVSVETRPQADGSVSVTAFVAVRTLKMSAETRPRTRLCCLRTAARTDTTTSSPVSFCLQELRQK